MNSRLTQFWAAVFALISLPLSAQIPQFIHYQAVLRDRAGEVLKSNPVQLRFTVRETDPEGIAVYIESHDILTNEIGVINLEIGSGDVMSGDFNGIDWSKGPYFLQIEANESGGGWSDMGTIQFMAVPYAFYAAQSSKAVDMQLSDLQNVDLSQTEPGHVLRWDGSKWKPAADTDRQQLAIEGGILSISGGNHVQLPQGADYEEGTGIQIIGKVIHNTGDLDASDDLTIHHFANGEVAGDFYNLSIRPGVITKDKISPQAVGTTEISDYAITTDKINNSAITAPKLSSMGAADGQVLKWSNFNKRWEPADDLDSNSDNQTLLLNGNQLSISGGNTVSLPASPSYVPGNGISIVGSIIQNTGDTNPNDDITVTKQAGGDLRGVFDELEIVPDAVTTGKLATAAVTAPKIADLAIVQSKIADNAVTTSKIQNGTITADDLSSMGATSGQVLKWSGSKWTPSLETSVWGNNGNHVYNSNMGNVGIGTTAPFAKLHVVTSGTVSGGLRLAATDVSSEGASLYLDAGITDWALIATNNGFSGGSDRFVIRNLFTSSNPLVIKADGMIGIGTDNPAYKLQAVVKNGEMGLVTAHFSNEMLSDNVRVVQAEYTGLSGNRNISAMYGKAVVNPGFGTGGEFEGGNFGITATGTGAGSNKQVVGVYGVASGTNGTRAGVFGYGNGSAGTSFNFGVYGATSGNGFANYAGYFLGNVHVSGNLSKSAGTFKIDHPADPENKYLVHSFVESPDMLNIYNGVIVTDENGFAVVELPAYFEALNRDFRYQLTCIGVFAQAIVKEKVKGNRFTIQTDKPSVEVSWQVTGIRNDPYAKANPVIPELEKPVPEKGTYLNPEVYGQPEGKRAGKISTAENQ